MCNIAACTGTRHPPLKNMQFFLFILGLIVLNNHIHNIQPTLQHVWNDSDCCFNISEDRHSCSEVMDVAGLSEGRGDVYETWLWTALFIWNHALFYGCVCIVHMNNSGNVTCIVCSCTSITLANSLNNVSTSRSSSSRSHLQSNQTLPHRRQYCQRPVGFR